MKNKIILIAALLTLGACTSTPAATTNATAPAAKVQTIDTAAQDKKEITGQGLLGAVWVRDSGEYRALSYQAYNSATDYLKEVVANPKNKEKKLAVVLDLDETVLDNSAFAAWQASQNEYYSSEAWARWVRAKEATEVPVAKAFLNTAKELGVEVFYVSNRAAELTTPTIENIKALGIPFADEAHILGKTDSSDKAARLQSVRDQGFEVAILCGDNLDDFDSTVHGKLNADRKAHANEEKGNYGTKFIVLPNPSYGGFDSGIVKGFYGLTDEQKTEARKNAVKAWDGK